MVRIQFSVLIVNIKIIHKEEKEMNVLLILVNVGIIIADIAIIYTILKGWNR